MLRLFRDHLAKYFIIASLVAFVATIFFSWGMGATHRHKQAANIGVINGKDLSYNQFYRIYSRTLNNATKDRDITDTEKRQILSNVWNQFISEFVSKDFEDNNNLTVTGDELFNFLKIHPPQDILQNPQFQKNGVFDTASYITNFLGNADAMKQNEKYVRYIEETYKNYLIKDKISRIVSGAVSISKFDEENFVKANSQVAKFEYIKVPFSKFNKSEIEVSNADIKSYYKKNIDKYKTVEQVNFAYMKIAKIPSTKDTLFVLNDLKDLRKSLAEGESFGNLASEYSESPGADTTKGDLGFLSKYRLPYAIKGLVDSMKVGEVTKNILFGNGYHIYKLENKDSTKYKISEIFMPIKITIDTEDSLREILENAKTTFSVANISIDTTGFFSLDKIIPGIGILQNATSFASNSNVNDVSEVLETQENVYILKIIGKNDKSHYTINEIKNKIVDILKRDSIKTKAIKYTKTLLPKLKTISMDSVANSDSFVMYYTTANEVKMSDYILGAGANSEFQTIGFMLKDKETSKKIVTTKDGAFIIKRIFSNTIDSTQIKALKMQYKIEFKANRRKFIQLWFQAIEQNANIEDYRYKYF